MPLKPIRRKKLRTSQRSDEDKEETTEDLDEDDMEIRRLEKLLSIDSKKGKRMAAEKLNQEYAKFEGITGGFGDFLMDLDDLCNSKKSKDYSKLEDERNKDGIELEEEDSPENIADFSLGDENDTNETKPIKSKRFGVDDTSDWGDTISPQPADHTSHVYRPVEGEDIYGRIIDEAKAGNGAVAKYVPPARRKQLLETDLVIKLFSITPTFPLYLYL